MSRENLLGIPSSPFYRGWSVLNEADHLLLDIHRLRLESKRHFVDQRLDAFSVSRAAQRLSLHSEVQACISESNSGFKSRDWFHLHRRSWGCCEILRCWRSSGCMKSPDLPHSCPPDVFEELKTQCLQFNVSSTVEKSHSTIYTLTHEASFCNADIFFVFLH